jgi:hypothetical protein
MDDYRPGAPSTTLSPPGTAPVQEPAAARARRVAELPRGAWTEATIAGLLAVLGILLYLPVAPFYFRPDDDGLMIFDALLVRAGGRPYHDFFVHDSPFINYWHALLLGLGGDDMLTLRYGLVPFKVLLLPAIYLLARPIAGRPAAVCAALMVLMADSGVNFGMPHPGWYAMALGFLGLLAVRAWLSTDRGAWLVGAGLALGLAVIVKQNLGLFLLAGCGLFLLEPIERAAPASGFVFRRGAESRGRWFARAGAWLLVLAGLLGMLRDQIHPDVLVLLWLPLLALAGISLWPGPPARNDPAVLWTALRRVALLAAGAVPVVVLWLLVLGTISGFDQLLPGLVLVPSVLPRVMFFPYKLPPPEFWQVVGFVLSTPLVCWGLLRLLPGRAWLAVLGAVAWVGGLLLLWGGADFVWQGGIFTWYYVPPALVWLGLLLPAPPDGAADAAPAGQGRERLYRDFLLYGAAFGMLQLYPLMDRVHGAWSYPFTLPLLAPVLERAWGWLRRGLVRAGIDGRVARRALAVSLLALPLFWGWFIAGWRLSLWWDVPASLAAGRPVASDWQTLDLPHASVAVPADAAAMFRGVCDLIDQKTRPDQPIFAFPNEQAFYVMCERPRGSRQSFLLPGVTTVAEQEEAIADLEHNHVGYVIMYMPGASLESLAPLANYLLAHYHPIGDFGVAPFTYAVLEHN